MTVTMSFVEDRSASLPAQVGGHTADERDPGGRCGRNERKVRPLEGAARRTDTVARRARRQDPRIEQRQDVEEP